MAEDLSIVVDEECITQSKIHRQFGDAVPLGPFLYWPEFRAHLNFKDDAQYIVLLAAAYNARGLIAPEQNGVAVLDDVNNTVLCDGIAQERTGYFGPSAKQIATFRAVRKLGFDEFCRFINRQPRARYRLGGTE